jgi:hypothetical protein
VLLPPDLKVRDVVGLRESKEPLPERWSRKHSEKLRELIRYGRFNHQACRQMLLDIRRLAGSSILLSERGKRKTYAFSGLEMEPSKRYPLFLYFEPEHIQIGQTQTVHFIERDAKTHRVEGGSTYRIFVTPNGEK